MNLINTIKRALFKKIPCSENVANPVITRSDKPNPYFDARRTYKAQVDEIIASRQTWQTMAILGLLIGLASVGGMIYIGSQSKFIPLVFKEDAQRNLISMTRGDRMGTATIEDYRAQAKNFIENLRLVTPDITLQRIAIFRAYAALSSQDPAIQKTNEFLQSSSPFERAATETVNTEIKSIIQATEGSWQLDWLETVRDRKGIIKNKYMMRALISLYQNEPTTKTSEEEVLNNPHFIFVRDFNWSKLQEVN